MRPTSEQKEALAAVSSLKRALGISNHPTKRDEFKEDDVHCPFCYIYTPDAQSAELLGELLLRIAVMPQGAAYFDRVSPEYSQRNTIEVKSLEEGLYEASMRVNDPEGFVKKVRKVIEKHISPDKPGRSR